MSTQAAQHNRRLTWQLDWGTSLFTLILFPALIGLGYWQLERGEEKAAITADWQQRQQLAAVPLLSIDGRAEALAHRKVTLDGEFLQGRDFLLDNRVQGGQYGFEVISAVRLRAENQLVLVNRGWIAGDPGRRKLPVIPPASAGLYQGVIYVPPGTAFRLGDETRRAQWPQVVLSLDVAWMEQVLGEPVYPFTIRLDAESPAALAADWPVINITPQKHTGYAVQWFSMAGVLLLLFLVRSTNVLAWWHARGHREE
jgi:surfeit locus 1 family protein